MTRVFTVIGIVAVVLLSIFLLVQGTAITWHFVFPTDRPETRVAKQELFRAQDSRTARPIRDQAGPREIQCDSSTLNLRFRDSLSGDSIIWFSRDAQGRYRCYDRDGYDPYSQSRKLLVTVEEADQVRILAQKPWPEFVRQPTTTVTRMATPASTVSVVRHEVVFRYPNDPPSSSSRIRAIDTPAIDNCQHEECDRPIRDR